MSLEQGVLLPVFIPGCSLGCGLSSCLLQCWDQSCQRCCLCCQVVTLHPAWLFCLSLKLLETGG